QIMPSPPGALDIDLGLRNRACVREQFGPGVFTGDLACEDFDLVRQDRIGKHGDAQAMAKRAAASQGLPSQRSGARAFARVDAVGGDLASRCHAASLSVGGAATPGCSVNSPSMMSSDILRTRAAARASRRRSISRCVIALLVSATASNASIS